MLYEHPIITTLPYTDAVLAPLCGLPGTVCLRDRGLDRVFIHPRLTQSFDTVDALLPWLKAHQAGSIAVFYLSYDAALSSMGLTPKASDITLPLLRVQLYDGHLEIDHKAKNMTSYALNPGVMRAHSQSLEQPKANTGSFVMGDRQFHMSYDEYAHAFEEVMQGLKMGDFYQVNLAQRFSIPVQGCSFALFDAISTKSPAEYACYWPLDQYTQILCNSPEAFIRVDGRTLVTEPIKGTIMRGADALSDMKLKQQLASSEKDRAENVMIVDLMRNDIGKIALPGSVKVEALFEIMTLRYAHHMVSRISATLPEHLHPLEALLACFPGGSITGAPKRAAMQAIHRLEPHARQLYCGSIGYVSAGGLMRSNIAIRTGIVQNQRMTCWAGGGLVLDSTAESEYQECLTKAQFAFV